MVGTLPVVLDGGRFTISRRCLMNQDALNNVSTCFNLAVAFLARNLLLFFSCHFASPIMSGFVNHDVLLSPRYCAVPGILQFDYCHEGRPWVRI